MGGGGGLQTANSSMSLTTIATLALFAASATRFISFRNELAGSWSPHVGVFLGIEPRRLVDLVGLGASRFDSLAGPLFDDEEGEDIVCSNNCGGGSMVETVARMAVDIVMRMVVVVWWWLWVGKKKK